MKEKTFMSSAITRVFVLLGTAAVAAGAAQSLDEHIALDFGEPVVERRKGCAEPM